ncbi:hypothetical protein ABZ734_13330 [Streptomyces sp. NPDC006660]|uniref:SCO2400 family protein n=1 Tax=Streptomyces sp. NPDC006660 TaxID=3156901 RepID=UPI0033C0CAF7
MDYCHSCRRHLNGALACAGCGTPAQELGPHPESEPDELLVYAGAPARTPGAAAPSGHRRRARPGRRARPRRGKAILFGAAGLVLVAGAVGFVQLALEPPTGDRASSVHDDESISDPQPLPSGSVAPAPARVTAEPVSSRGHGRGAAGGQTPRGERSDGPRRESPSPKTSASLTHGPGAPPSGPAAPTSSASPGVSDAPGPQDPPPSTGPKPPPPPPPPTPTPTKTCHRFLWWCS